MFSTEIFHSGDIDWSCVLGENGIHIELVCSQGKHEWRDLFQLPLLSGGEENVQSLHNSQWQTLLSKSPDDRRSLLIIYQDKTLQVLEVSMDAIWYRL